MTTDYGPESVRCPRCGAKVGEQCIDDREPPPPNVRVFGTFNHLERHYAFDPTLKITSEIIADERKIRDKLVRRAFKKGYVIGLIVMGCQMIFARLLGIF